jgi:hypothetical protein
MNKRLLVWLSFFLFLPSLVSAQGLFGNWYGWLGIPEEWTRPPKLIFYIFIPFLGTFAIIWGSLTATRAPIFRNQRVNILLSFIFAIALFYSGIMPAVVLYLFMFGGAFGVIAFFVLFFVLIFLLGAKKIGLEYKTTREIFEEIPKEDIKKTTELIDKQFKESEKIRKELQKIDVKLINEERAITALLRQASVVRRITNPETLKKRWGVTTQQDAWKKIRHRINIHDENKMRLLKRKRELIEQLDKLTEAQAQLGSI